MDNKTIKITHQLYNELDRYRMKNETFSDALRKLLNVAELIRAGASTLGPIGFFDISEPRPGDQLLSEFLDDRREQLERSRGEVNHDIN